MITFLQAAQSVAATEETRMGLWELFSKGGWLMWPLLILGGVTIFIFVERFMAIRKASVMDMNFMNRIRDYISDGKIDTAMVNKLLTGAFVVPLGLKETDGTPGPAIRTPSTPTLPEALVT